MSLPDLQIILFDDQALARAQAALARVAPNLTQPMEIIIRPHQPPRTGRQLAYYEHDVLTPAARHLGNTASELHVALLSEHYAGHPDLPKWLAEPNAWQPRKREMSDYLTWCEVQLAEYGAPVSAHRAKQALRWA